MLSAHPQHSASCPPKDNTLRARLRRTHSSHDLTDALNLIDLVDVRWSDKEEGRHFIHPAMSNSQKPKARHARMWSMTKRKQRALERHSSLEKSTSRAKRSRSGSYSISSASDSRLASPGTPSPSDMIPRSPSNISLMDLGSPALKTGNGYKKMGSIVASVSPTTYTGNDPAQMYLEQAKKLERRLQAEAVRLGATAIANSTITSVEDSGSMAASGIAVIVTAPEQA